MPRITSPTLGGIAAILIWSSCIAVGRRLSESLGVFTSAALIFLIAGLVSLIVRAFQPGSFRAMCRLPLPYFVWCGSLFVICQIGLYGGMGLAKDRLQVLEVGAINYLWPAFTLVFGVAILGLRSRLWLLAIGTLIACSGVFAVTLGPGAMSVSSVLARLTTMPAAYLFALAGALSWSVYSSLARRLVGGEHDAIPVFLFASGVALALVRLFVHETSLFNAPTLAALAYAGLFVAWGAYALWDIGVRRGNFSLLSALSYAIPVLSTLLSSAVLGVRPPALLWIGVAAITVGAVICKIAVDVPTANTR